MNRLRKETSFLWRWLAKALYIFSVDHFYTYLQIAAQSLCLLFAIKFDFFILESSPHDDVANSALAHSGVSALQILLH